jgi:uncharacterized protein (TIGR03435 family)
MFAKTERLICACLLAAAAWSNAAASTAFAQQASATAAVPAKPDTLPQFEAASVRPSGPDRRELNGFRIYPGGRIIAKGCTLQYLIMLALNVQHFQIDGLPAWAHFTSGDAFDLQAVPPENSQSAKVQPAFSIDPPIDEERRMLLALLIERFQLKFHIENREGQVYLLERGTGRLNLRAPADKNAYPWAGGNYKTFYSGKNIPMPNLAQRLGEWIGRPVIDRTDLIGSFDFDYKIDDPDNDADITGFLLTAMKAIGLELKSSKGPIETIVIDHVEKPSAN